jgi:hypothetical protein
MGKSSAQRQREYRRRRSEGEGESRVNTWLSTSANLALERLAAHHGRALKSGGCPHLLDWAVA